MSARLHYIDWLRVLAVLLLLPFHVSRVFNAGEPFYVKSAEQSAALNLALGFINVWHMPLLFFLAGASTYFALRKRSGRQYLAERVRRIMLPFVFGVFVLIPPQTWIGARFNSGYTASYAHYLTSGDFLVWNIRDGGDYYGGFGVGHLWFLLWLFAVSLAALPLLLWGRERGASAFTRWAHRLAHPAWWTAAGVLLLLGDALPDPVGKNPFFFLGVFVLGYTGMCDDFFVAGAEKHRWLALVAGVSLSAWWVVSVQLRDSLPDPSLGRAVLALLGMLATWTAIVAAVGFGRRFLDKPSPALSYLAPASYPLYILHQTVIVLLAWWVVRLPVGGVEQWTILLAASVAVTFASYEVVRRIPVIRAAFGID